MHIVAMVHRGYICVKKMKSNDDFRRNSVDRDIAQKTASPSSSGDQH